MEEGWNLDKVILKNLGDYIRMVTLITFKYFIWGGKFNRLWKISVPLRQSYEVDYYSHVDDKANKTNLG